MFFKRRGGTSGQEKKRERKRERVIRFLDEIFKSHDLSNILLEYLKSHLRQLPPDVKNALKDTLGVETTRNEAPLAKPKIIPEPPRENTFQEIDDLVFERIQYIVSDASLSKNFSDHPLDPDDLEKGMLDAKIRGLQYNSVVNLISRIRRELNTNVSGEQKDVLGDEPNLEAVLAIKGLMNTLTKATQSDGNIKITGLSNHAEVNRFITACFQEPKDIFKAHDYQSLDHQYYAFVVGNAKFILEQEARLAHDRGSTQDW
jgi:hypothetical protein